MYRKRKTKARCLLTVLFMAMCIPGFAFKGNGKTKSEWNLAKESGGVTIHYRWIEAEGFPKTREMRAQFVIESELPEIILCFSDPEKYMLWASCIKECRFDKASDSAWIVYSVMNYPWPFNKKILVTSFSIQNSKEGSIIRIKAFSEKNPGVSESITINQYEGAWYFIPSQNGEILVDYRVVSCTKPVFPRFIQDPVIQKICIKSFNGLKKLAEKK